MPTEIGTAVKLRSAADCRRFNHAGEVPGNQVSAGESRDATMAIRYTMTTTEAAKAIHLICWRSSPLERRKRNTKLRAETSMQSGNSGRTAYPALGSHCCPSSPKGLRTPPRPCNGPGESMTPTLANTSTAPESHARGRHLLEGSLP